MAKTGIAFGSVVVGLVLLFSESKENRRTLTPAKTTTTEQWNEDAIKSYVDSINHILPKANKQNSLVYSKGDYSFQVSKYMHAGKPVLYIEKSGKGENAQIEKRYYLKDNSLALYTENAHVENTPVPYISTLAYFRNNKLVYAEQKAALSDSGLNAVSFQKADLEKRDQFSDLAMLEDALEQRGPFNLVFEGIAEYPKAKYIILGKEGMNSYRAPIRVENEDEFIHELSTNQYSYRGEKLDISWNTGDSNEVTYQSGKLSRD